MATGRSLGRGRGRNGIVNSHSSTSHHEAAALSINLGDPLQDSVTNSYNSSSVSTPSASQHDSTANLIDGLTEMGVGIKVRDQRVLVVSYE
jgi:hypothetical protein